MSLRKTDALRPGVVDEALIWLKKKIRSGRVAVVGHEPSLSILGSRLLIESPGAFMTLKKGAAMLLRFDGRIRPGGATLRWLLQPAQLRGLGKH